MLDKMNQVRTITNDSDTSESHKRVQTKQPLEADGWLVVWKRTAARLQIELGEEIYTSWFAGIKIEGVYDGKISLSVSTKFLRNWILSHYKAEILDSWQKESDISVTSIELFVRGPGRVIDAKGGRVIIMPSGNQNSISNTYRANSNEPISVQTRIDDIKSPLDPRYTFEYFAVGPANSLAYNAAQSIAKAQPMDGTHFNILCVHAPVGLGKTHLLQATATEAQKHHFPDKVVYLTAERFMYRFVTAVRANDMLTFKKYIRSIQLLLIDDIQFLQGKSTQQEFCHSLNELIETGRRVIIAADKPPASLESLDARMRSRLSSGLLVNIQPCDKDLRLKVLQCKLRSAQQRIQHLHINQNILELLAEQVRGNGRELEGAFNRILAHYQFNNAEMTLPIARNAIQDLIRNTETNRIRIEQIQSIVAKHFNISRQDIISNRRNRLIVRPRQISMYLTKIMTDRSLPEIGRRFGGRDHTTVLHAIRKIESMMQEDKIFSEEVEMLRHMVEG